MKFRRPAPDSLDINLTPLIDCLLFLIIFFMLSTTFTKASKLQITLPEANAEQSATSPTSLEVTVSATGEYAVNGELVSSKDAVRLRAVVESASQGKRDIPFLISADGNAPHQAVVAVMDVAGQLGFTGLSISTRQPGKP